MNPGEYSSDGAEGFKLDKGRCFFIFNVKAEMEVNNMEEGSSS